MNDLIFTLATIAEVAAVIVCKVQGFLSLGIFLVIVCCAAAFLLPFGLTICLVICKLTGVLSLGWSWLVGALILDGIRMPGYASLMHSNYN